MIGIAQSMAAMNLSNRGMLRDRRNRSTRSHKRSNKSLRLS